MKQQPAKTIADIRLPEENYKADFDLADRYSGFASEIVRFSLLGIAGYGFLISEVVMKSKGNIGADLNRSKELLMAGIIALGISSALALMHRFNSTSCLFKQIRILRGLQRLESTNWSEEEKIREKAELDNTRFMQQNTSNFCHKTLMAATAFLAAGLILVVIVFFVILLHV